MTRWRQRSRLQVTLNDLTSSWVFSIFDIAKYFWVKSYTRNQWNLPNILAYISGIFDGFFKAGLVPLRWNFPFNVQLLNIQLEIRDTATPCAIDLSTTSEGFRSPAPGVWRWHRKVWRASQLSSLPPSANNRVNTLDWIPTWVKTVLIKRVGVLGRSRIALLIGSITVLSGLFLFGLIIVLSGLFLLGLIIVVLLTSFRDAAASIPPFRQDHSEQTLRSWMIPVVSGHINSC